jgi:ribosomal-protein-alanine N-acetyltransferase
MSSAKVAGVSIEATTVELMTEHDLLEVVEIEESCGLSLWGWDGYHTELERRESIMLVARRAGWDERQRLLGFVAARVGADEVHVNNIGVREEMRRSGLGSLLLRTALQKSRMYGAVRAILEVRASNQVAQKLYRRHGFAVAGRRKNYYKNPTEDALIMAAELEPEA